MTVTNKMKFEKPLAATMVSAAHASTAQSSKNYDLILRRQQHLGGSILFYQDPVHIVKGKGTWLYDKQGNRYLDCYNNVASVGHCHPRVTEALTTQASLLNTHTRYLHENVVNYAEHLASTMPGDLEVCLFTCSGTEANELAMRIARAVSENNGAIVLENSYHGNSTLINELSTGAYPKEMQPNYVATVEPPNTYRGSFRAGEPDVGTKYAAQMDGAIEQLNHAGQGVAAFMCDSIFDTQGTLEAPQDYFKLSYEKVRAAGGLCIADEVQAGFGRTGDHMWGFENYDVVPDIVTLGKPMGAGHPVAAVVTTHAIAKKFSESAFYFNTFGGNPVSTAVAETVLSVIEEEKLQQNAQEVGAYLKNKLKALAEKHALIGDVRGRGLFLGVELVSNRDTLEPATMKARTIAEKMKDEGILMGATGHFGNCLKIRPPMVFSKENGDFLVEKLDKLLIEANA